MTELVEKSTDGKEKLPYSDYKEEVEPLLEYLSKQGETRWMPRLDKMSERERNKQMEQWLKLIGRILFHFEATVLGQKNFNLLVQKKNQNGQDINNIWDVVTLDDVAWLLLLLDMQSRKDSLKKKCSAERLRYDELKVHVWKFIRAKNHYKPLVEEEFWNRSKLGRDNGGAVKHKMSKEEVRARNKRKREGEREKKARKRLEAKHAYCEWEYITGRRGMPPLAGGHGISTLPGFSKPMAFYLGECQAPTQVKLEGGSEGATSSEVIQV